MEFRGQNLPARISLACGTMSEIFENRLMYKLYQVIWLVAESNQYIGNATQW